MDSICADSRSIAEDFRTLLHASERRFDAQRHAARLERIAERLELLLRAAVTPGDPRVVALLASLQDVHRVVEEIRTPGGALDWSAWRQRAADAYESLAARLRALRVRVPNLRPSNYVRNAFHVAWGLVALALVELLPGRAAMIAISGSFLVFAWTMEIGRRRSEAWSRFASALFRRVIHPHEHARVNSATWFVTALFCLSLWAPIASCAAAVTVLALADPAAAIIGRRFGRTRVRQGRSLEGTAAFLAVALLAAFGVLAAFHPELGVGRIAALAVVGAGAGALAELYAGIVDDNFVIPVAVAAATWPLLALMG